MAGLLASAFSSESDDDSDGASNSPDIPDVPEVPEVPELPEEPDTGATLSHNEDGSVTVELGEDETGSLVTIVTDEQYVPYPTNSGHSSASEHTATLFLVPEGIDLEDEYQDFLTSEDDEFTDYLSAQGASVLDAFDLGNEGFLRAEQTDPMDRFEAFDTHIPIPEILSDQPVAYYAPLGDDIGQFDPSAGFPYDPPPPATDNADTLVAAGTVTNGLAGDDTITGTEDNPVRLVEGGEGDDLIYDVASVAIHGGTGDDTIDVGPTEFVFGEDGNDVIRLDDPQADTEQTYIGGGSGDDYLVATGETTISGGEGDDTLTAGGVSEDSSGLYRQTLIDDQGSNTFQVMGPLGELTGGTLDDPIQLASIRGFDSADDTLVLSSNLPGPITPTYSDGTLLLELGDGSFASIYLGVETFDVSTIQLVDIEAEVDAAFATTP
ncbi:hypothetical protein [uncultured Pelagimonas sp.]|uniref:hypothetical protein n=1 Tax=uncultured Pelagimonas sp. TaxID=1618102 RepID=UPI00261347EB|nr:hypothetical protein [uncultured Pelagimonas sp.]